MSEEFKQFREVLTEEKTIEALDIDFTDGNILYDSGVVTKNKEQLNITTTKRAYTAGARKFAAVLPTKYAWDTINTRVKQVWQTGVQRTILSILQGTATELSIEDITDDFGLVFMHSVVFQYFKEKGLITYKEEGKIGKPYFKNIPVLVDDYTWEYVGSNYSLYFLKKDAIYFEEDLEKTSNTIIDEEVEDEVMQEAFKEEILLMEKELSIGVSGCTFTCESTMEGGPIDEELSNPENWEGKSNSIVRCVMDMEDYLEEKGIKKYW